MGEQVPEQQNPQHPFTAEEITQANAGDHQALANGYVDQAGGYMTSEADSPESFQDSIVLSDQAEAHAAKVVEGVKDMYEDAYDENAKRDASGEK